MAGIFGGALGSIIGGMISGAINAANNAANSSKPSGGSSGSSSGGSSQPSYGDSSGTSRPSGSSSGSSKPSSGGGVPMGTKRPGSFTGSASGIQAGNDFEQSIIDKMNENSAAWWEAKTQAERDALHKQNQQLAGMLGSGVQYNNGVWTGTTSGSYMPQDQRAYIEALYKAQLEAQKEALKQAYENNLSGLWDQQAQLESEYETARNDTAAQSALTQQRYNETAAAYGLNSGTAGQAALSFATQLQSDLGALQSAESAASAEIDRQRALLGREYESALAQAQADNDYARFQALYEEAVRVDQALQQQSQFNAQQAMKHYQMLLDQYYQEREWDFSQEQWQYQKEQDQYERELAAAKQSSKGSGSSGSSGGSSGRGSGGSSAGSANGSTGDPVVDAYRAGYKTFSAAVGYFKSLGYGDGLSQELARDLEKRVARGELGVNQQKVLQLYNNIIDMRDTPLNRNDPNFARKAIEEYRKQTSLKLNDDEVAWLLKQFGYTS